MVMTILRYIPKPMTMKNYFKSNIALEFPSAATLRAAVMGRGSNSGAFVFNHVRDRQPVPTSRGPLPGFTDTPQGESEGLYGNHL